MPAVVAEPVSVSVSVKRSHWDLVLPHRERLLRIALRRLPSLQDAEDCVQEALIRAACTANLDESAGCQIPHDNRGAAVYRPLSDPVGRATGGGPDLPRPPGAVAGGRGLRSRGG